MTQGESLAFADHCARLQAQQYAQAQQAFQALAAEAPPGDSPSTSPAPSAAPSASASAAAPPPPPPAPGSPEHVIASLVLLLTERARAAPGSHGHAMLVLPDVGIMMRRMGAWPPSERLLREHLAARATAAATAADQAQAAAQQGLLLVPGEAPKLTTYIAAFAGAQLRIEVDRATGAGILFLREPALAASVGAAAAAAAVAGAAAAAASSAAPLAPPAPPTEGGFVGGFSGGNHFHAGSGFLPHEVFVRKAARACYSCGGDHLRAHCPLTLCHVCSEGGHIAEACPKRAGAVSAAAAVAARATREGGAATASVLVAAAAAGAGGSGAGAVLGGGGGGGGGTEFNGGGGGYGGYGVAEHHGGGGGGGGHAVNLAVAAQRGVCISMRDTGRCRFPPGSGKGSCRFSHDPQLLRESAQALTAIAAANANASAAQRAAAAARHAAVAAAAASSDDFMSAVSAAAAMAPAPAAQQLRASGSEWAPQQAGGGSMWGFAGPPAPAAAQPALALGLPALSALPILAELPELPPLPSGLAAEALGVGTNFLGAVF